jgi:tripartite-type tricarboxylate transporter receptor subunit TctC
LHGAEHIAAGALLFGPLLVRDDLRQQLDRQSMAVMASSPAEFAAAIRSEIEHWKRAVKESGAHIN